MDTADLDERHKALIDYLVGAGFLKTPEIIEAFRNVPRRLFVGNEAMEFAYDDMAIPAIKESTISQPSTVALMLECLQPRKGWRVLEIGTGSGWEACLLSHCVGGGGLVVTMESDPGVARFGRKNIERMKMANIRVVVGDGSLGYPDAEPYDGIIVTAACPEIPPPLLKQLKVRGRIVAPVGTKGVQTMRMVEKLSGSKLEEKSYGSFNFVPLVGQFGF